MALLDRAKSLLSAPWAFELYQQMVGAPACHQRFVDDYVKPKSGDRVIDFGCGTGVSLLHLPREVDYVGIDNSEKYIEAARARFNGRGRFICEDVEEVDLAPYGPFDVGISFGVIHHLTDQTAHSMLRQAKKVIRSGGRFVTIDPCYLPGQPRIARFLIDHDRGTFPRDEAAYRRLLEPYGALQTHVVTNMLRIPYTMLVAALEI